MEVRRWIEAGRLPFPDLSEDDAERLRGTIEYPPIVPPPGEDEPEKG